MAKTSALLMVVLLLLVSPAQCQEERTSNYEHLKALEPLIGKWVFDGEVKEDSPLFKKGTKLRVETEYKWTPNRNTIVMRGTGTVSGEKVLETREVTHWNPKIKKIISLAVDSSDASSRGQWTVEGSTLSVAFHGLDGDGNETSSINIVTVEDDSYAWQSTAKMRSGEQEPDTGVYTLQRVTTIPGTVIKDLDGFVGSWEAEGNLGDKLRTGTFRCDWEYGPDGEKCCLKGHFAYKRGDSHRSGINLIGWNAEENSVEDRAFTIDGGHGTILWNRLSDTHWRGTMRSYDDGDVVESKLELIKKGPNEFVMEGKTNDGVVSRVVCRRASGG